MSRIDQDGSIISNREVAQSDLRATSCPIRVSESAGFNYSDCSWLKVVSTLRSTILRRREKEGSRRTHFPICQVPRLFKNIRLVRHDWCCTSTLPFEFPRCWISTRSSRARYGLTPIQHMPAQERNETGGSPGLGALTVGIPMAMAKELAFLSE